MAGNSGLRCMYLGAVALVGPRGAIREITVSSTDSVEPQLESRQRCWCGKLAGMHQCWTAGCGVANARARHEGADSNSRAAAHGQGAQLVSLGQPWLHRPQAFGCGSTRINKASFAACLAASWPQVLELNLNNALSATYTHISKPSTAARWF